MQEHQHYKIYKPYGVLSQFTNNQKRRKNKKLLGDLHDFSIEPMAIGRLDEDSEGLLLLTTDGKVSEDIRSKKVEKEYLIQVDGIINNTSIEELKKGVEIGSHGKKYRTLPCNVSLADAPKNLPDRKKKIRDPRHGPTSWAKIILTEGKFRQVKKMTAAVGFPTLRLIRVRVGNEHLENLQPGEIRQMEGFSYEKKETKGTSEI